MDHMGRGNHICEGLEMPSPHMRTHTSFILHIGVCAFLWLATTHKNIAHFINLALCNLQVLCCAYPSNPSKFSTIPYNRQLPYLLPLSPISLLNISSTEISRYYHLILLLPRSLNSTLWSSINTIRDGKDISWHQRAELCYPHSSFIHFCSRHAQTLFVLLFIGMYLTVWQCCVCEHSHLCSSRQLTLVHRAEGGKSALLSLLLN